MKFSVLNRKIHYWLSFCIALPLAVIVCSGITLQLKKQFHWIQPTEKRGDEKAPKINFDDILRICQSVSEAGVKTWDDVNRIDVRPSKGMLKVWCMNNWEVQIDIATGNVLQVAFRRSDMIEAIHDGSWFHDKVKYWLFLPVGISLFVLWLSGLYLFIHPYWVKWRRPKRAIAVRPPTM